MKVPGFEPTDPIDPRMIEGAERLLGVDFPPLYRQLLREFQGSYGEAQFDVPGSDSPASIGLWLAISPWSSESMWDHLSNWPEHGLPREIVPIADNGCGDSLCLDYRGRSEPAVAMWYHEVSGTDGLYRISESFAEFFELLTDASGEDDDEEDDDED